MILRVKGSHHFFRNVCQHVKNAGKESIDKITSSETIEKEINEITDTLLDMLNMEMSYYMQNMPSLTDFDLFPECDEEADHFEEYAADLDDDGYPDDEIDELVLQAKLFMVIDILARPILLNMFYSKITQEAA
jgi:hypothetical protein